MTDKFSENDVIEFLMKGCGAGTMPLCGIGDDAAVLLFNEKFNYLLSTDMLAEGVHFRKETTTASSLAKKAIEVNLSDIAAMGGIPLHLLVSLSLPTSLPQSWIEEFLKSLSEVAKARAVTIIGGDTIKNSSQIVISITAIGKQLKEKIKYRSKASVGDTVAVSGPLGLSLAALSQIEMGEVPNSLLQQALNEPSAHVSEGIFLANFDCVTAMMDVSDGLYQDLPKLCRQSHCGAIIKLESIPTTKEVKDFCKFKNYKWDEFSLSGGEDYCLLFTIKKDATEKMASLFNKEFGRNLYIVGEITEVKEILFTRSEKKVLPKDYSFHHFT